MKLCKRCVELSLANFSDNTIHNALDTLKRQEEDPDSAYTHDL